MGALAGGEWAYLLPLLQLLHYVRHNGPLTGFGLFTLQMATFMGVFTPIGLCVHHSAHEVVGTPPADEENPAPGTTGQEAEYKTRAWHEGQPGAETDFGKHQVKATSDHSVGYSSGTFFGNYLSLSLWGFLNDHSAHHLFPAIDHSKHYLYRDVMRQTFKEFGLEYTDHNFADLVGGVDTMIKQRSTFATLGGAQKQLEAIG